MKKQLLLLFAASALFAACSSDDMPAGNETNNGQEPTTEVDEYATSCSVTTDEGVGMSVGAFDAVNTRAESENVYFDIVIDNSHLLNWEEYFLEADDFAIRKNGDYIAVKAVDNSLDVPWNNKIKISETDNNGELTIRVEGLHEMTEASGDYTFEAYLWIENKKELNDGSGSYGELFTEEDKREWIKMGEDEEFTDKTETGFDLTQVIEDETNAQLHDANAAGQAQPEKGYEIRYNVYRGLSGHGTDGQGNFELGDTPYIKVSIHARRLGADENTRVIAIYPSENPAE